MASKSSSATPQRPGNLTGSVRVLNDLVVTFYNIVQNWKSSVIDGVRQLQKIQSNLESPYEMEKHCIIVGCLVADMSEKVLELEKIVIKLENLAKLNADKPKPCRTWSYDRIVHAVTKITEAHREETCLRQRLVKAMETRTPEELEAIVLIWLHANVVDQWIDACLETLLIECRLKY